MHLFWISLRLVGVASDVLYVIKVPFWNEWLRLAACVFIIAPIAFSLVIALNKKNGTGNQMMYWFLLNLNLINITEKSAEDS